MPLNLCEMITENQEGYSDFNIDRDWYKNRKSGLSAVIRCYGEEQWIGPCLESCLPFYDEIIVTLTPKEGDRTEDIGKSFHSPKIRILEYPFKLDRKQKAFTRKAQQIFLPHFGGFPSVHSYSYYTNWGMSKTKYSHVAPRWDADMILCSEFSTDQFKQYVLSKSMVYVSGYNVVTEDFQYISRLYEYQGPEQRFYKVDKYRYSYGEGDALTYQGIVKLAYPGRWYQFPVQQVQSLFNNMVRKDVFIKTPVFFHTKLLKDAKSLYTDGHTGRNLEFGALNSLMQPGKKILVNIPNYVTKKPEDYINQGHGTT
jgi:hypothetical protein